MPPASAGRPAAPAREHLVQLLRPVVEDAGYELEDVSVTSAGRRSLIRVTVDAAGGPPGSGAVGAGGGIDLDGVAVVSRAVSDALDEGADRFAGPYVLEVSSPGVDRPLTEPRHWRRAIGRLVQFPVGEVVLTGRVRAVTDAGVRLDVDGAVRDLAWSELGRGQVQVEFNRPEPGREGQEGTS